MAEEPESDSGHAEDSAGDAQEWDERYRSHDRLFSGAPNAVLVAEAAGLPPGRALDVGCGEGADARWLASRGWQVTAVDISAVALERAAADAEAAGVASTGVASTGTEAAAGTESVAGADGAGRVTWTQADLTTTPPPADAFDLVSAQYFPLLRQHPGHTALRGLLAAVAPGGTLLFVGHDLTDLRSSDHASEVDFDAYYQPGEIAGLLGGDWTVLVDETRPRAAPAPAGTHHTHDVVLRAQRVR
ncbi:class I SAM-dependent methyltransferase [Streptomyces sp. 891-h]|uniref:class I SAM-dependent methyltransferase n=1 Tax=unclassified Streptomyces TaxID=2593676 RepID=UPI001FA9EC45|nr:class I SAM-dependent methyltransferase [Streptomyces sp. 891-h]UNZ20942.1 class I SAM-dependent methyltransferase [Streptomyces sp. 891-h]